MLHNFNVDPKSWHFDYYAKNNSCRGASGNTLPCLSFLLRPFQSTSPGMSHKPPILYHWCRGHAISYSAFCCSQYIAHSRTCKYFFRPLKTILLFLKEVHKTRTTEPQLLVYTLALAMIQRFKLQLSLNSLHQPAGLIRSLREIPNGGTTPSSIKQNLPAGWLRY